MSIEIRVPTLGESVTEATVGKWFKKAGEAVKADEPLVELETDKVTVEVPAPFSGVMGEILVKSGTTVAVGSILGALQNGTAAAVESEAAAPVDPVAPGPASTSAPLSSVPINPAPPQPAAQQPAPHATQSAPAPVPSMPPSPAARKALDEAGLDASAISGSGRRGQILKEDVAATAATAAATPAQTGNLAPRASPPPLASAAPPKPSAPLELVVPAQSQPRSQSVAVQSSPVPLAVKDLRLPSASTDASREERVKLTRLRQTIARRLKDAQNTAAMLTTFNDVDMSAVMALRNQYKDIFEKRHGVKLGFMGLFVKACIQALRDIPAVNAEIDGDELIYKNYYHIGVAVGTDKGLVVPVVRDADRISLAETEQKITEFGRRARDGKLTIEDMQGGTFTISNGGVTDR